MPRADPHAPIAPLPIALEDNFNDVIAKVLRGRGLAPAALAARAGVDPAAVQRLLDGELDEAAARAVAPHLGLGTESLVALAKGAYQPEAAPPDGLLGFNTPYDDYFVNAYLVWDPASKRAIAFDTGSDVADMLAAIRDRGLTLELILVTHTHPDHVMRLKELTAATGAPVHSSATETAQGASPISPGHTFDVGALKVLAKKTTGHSVGGMSYYVTGLAHPVVVVGDALFAGSMGGGMVSFEDALANNRREIFSLPDDTVICPGHGPFTTVGLEKANNPFYPEFGQQA